MIINDKKAANDTSESQSSHKLTDNPSLLPQAVPSTLSYYEQKMAASSGMKTGLPSIHFTSSNSNQNIERSQTHDIYYDKRNDQIQKDKDIKDMSNPFTLTKDEQTFTYRQQEQNEKKKRQKEQNKLPIWEKTNAVHSMQMEHSKIFRTISETGSEDDLALKQKQIAIDYKMRRGNRLDRETTQQYIERKRKMFRIRYTVQVSRSEMKRLEDDMEVQDKTMTETENHLDCDLKIYEEFLRETEKSCMDAMKLAEEDIKKRIQLEKVIKRLDTDVRLVQSDFNRFQELVRRNREYKKFLYSIAPETWKQMKREQKKQQDAQMQQQKHAERQIIIIKPSTSKHSRKLIRKSSATVEGPTPKYIQLKKKKQDATNQNLRSSISNSHRKRSNRTGLVSSQKQALKKISNVDVTKQSLSFAASSDITPTNSENDSIKIDDEEDDGDLDNFFKNPQELFDLFTELEAQNLSLIQNNQEMEETIEIMKQQASQSRKKVQHEMESLIERLEIMDEQILSEEHQNRDLKENIQVFTNYGDAEQTKHEEEIDVVTVYVKDVYDKCIGDNEGRQMDMLQMLVLIETRLYEIFDIIETLPQEKLEAAEKQYDKERRYKLRQEKFAAQKENTEARTRKALARSKSIPNIHIGRPLKPRSLPPLNKNQAEKKKLLLKEKEEDELVYYYSPCCAEITDLVSQRRRRQLEARRLDRRIHGRYSGTTSFGSGRIKHTFFSLRRQSTFITSVGSSLQ